MPMVNMLEAKTKLSRLVEAVESGAESEIVIARKRQAGSAVGAHRRYAGRQQAYRPPRR